jgi:predicted RNA-binding Zn ribbon-like protein
MVTDRARSAVTTTVRSAPPDLCLTFANTRFWRGTETPTEELTVPNDLLKWGAANAGFDAQTQRRFAASWATDPGAGAAVFRNAIALREALYRSFAATAEGSAIGSSDLRFINRSLARHPKRTELRRGAAGVGWAIAGAADLELLLAPVLWSAGDLLTGPRLSRVRCCANDQCRWLFLDDSKSGNRRWCAMSACGNRAKAHRHYAKLKAARLAASRPAACAAHS